MQTQTAHTAFQFHFPIEACPQTWVKYPFSSRLSITPSRPYPLAGGKVAELFIQKEIDMYADDKAVQRFSLSYWVKIGDEHRLMVIGLVTDLLTRTCQLDVQMRPDQFSWLLADLPILASMPQGEIPEGLATELIAQIFRLYNSLPDGDADAHPDRITPPPLPAEDYMEVHDTDMEVVHADLV